MTQASITAGSTRPNIRPNSCRRSNSTTTLMATEKTMENISSWLAASLARSASPVPTYWETTTAPPAANAVNRKINTVLNWLVSETPATAASPA